MIPVSFIHLLQNKPAQRVSSQVILVTVWFSVGVIFKTWEVAASCRGRRSRCSQGENDSGDGGSGDGRNGKTPRTIPTCLREMIRAKSHLFGQSSLRGLVRGLGNTESLTKQQTAGSRRPRSVCAKFKFWRAAALSRWAWPASCRQWTHGFERLWWYYCS